MKYALGILAAIIALMAITSQGIEDPDGPYAGDQGAMVLWFYESGRLSIMVVGGSSIDLNGKGLDGPSQNRVTETTWKRKGKKIYVLLPGETQAIPALTIDGKDILMDNIRFKKVDISGLVPEKR